MFRDRSFTNPDGPDFMKLSIERAVLLRALAHVQSVVERRNTIPILSNVRLEAKDGQLHLAATDMDLEVVEAVSADLQVAGSTTAPAHVLYDICRKLPEGSEVALDATGDAGRLSIACGRIHFRLPCLPPEDFPVMSGGDFSHKFALPASELRRMIDKTRFAISTEETRYYLNGIYLHGADAESGPMLRAVATDGHRLARIDSEQPDGAAGMPGIIVPRKAVGELRKLVDEIDGAVEIELSDTKIRFAFDTVVLTSKLIDGTFPDYERVIPSNNDKTLEADAGVSCRRSTAWPRSRPTSHAPSSLPSTRTGWCFRPTAPTARPARRSLRSNTAGLRSRSASTPATCSKWRRTSKANACASRCRTRSRPPSSTIRATIGRFMS